MSKQFVLIGLMAWLALAGLQVGCGGGGGGGSSSADEIDVDDDDDGDTDGDTDAGDSDGDSGETATSGYKVIEVKDGGTISGTVSWKGDKPGADEMTYEYTVADDQADTCGKEMMVSGKRKNLRLAIGEGGGVGNVVVWIETSEGVALKKTAEVVIDNKHCEFAPLITLIPRHADVKVKFTSSDGTVNHNAKGAWYPWEGDADPGLFNESVTGSSSATYGDGFEADGLLRINCSLHYWMEGFAIVHNHPYIAKTGADGKFKIDAPLKPGKYKIHFWHAGYKPRTKDGKVVGFGPASGKGVRWTQEIEIKAGANTVDSEYKK